MMKIDKFQPFVEDEEHIDANDLDINTIGNNMFYEIRHKDIWYCIHPEWNDKLNRFTAFVYIYDYDGPGTKHTQTKKWHYDTVEELMAHKMLDGTTFYEFFTGINPEA